MSNVDATAVIPAYNCADTLERSVNATLSQTGVSIEVIVVDDCSSDSTFSRASELAKANPNVHAYKLEKNSGPAAARNRALEHANGRWIIVIDADDTMLPGRLERMIRFAEQKKADVVLDNFTRVDMAGEPIDGTPYLSEHRYQKSAQWSLHDYISGNLFAPGKPNLGYLKPVLRRSFLDERQIRYDENLRNSEDYHLIAECLANGANVWYLPDSGYRYTVREGSISHRVSPDLMNALVHAEDGFRERHRAVLTPPLQDLLRRRRATILDIAAVEKIMNALKSHRYATAIGALAARPRSCARLTRHLTEAVVSRL